MFPPPSGHTGTSPASNPPSFVDKDQQTSTSHPAKGSDSSIPLSGGRAAYPSASSKGEALRQEWDSINRKELGLPAEISFALEEVPALKIMCDELMKDGWKIYFGPENKGSGTIDNAKEIVIDGKRKSPRAALLTTLAHEIAHAQYNWSHLMKMRSDGLLLGEQLSEKEYVLSCAKNEGHAMFAEFRLLAMCEDNPGLQQEIELYLQNKYGNSKSTEKPDAAYQKGMALYRQWRSSPDDDAKEAVVDQARADLGMLFADFIGGHSKRPYKETWKADFAKTPHARRPLSIKWMLPQSSEFGNPRLVTIYTENFERTLAGYSDPQAAREVMTHAVRNVVPQVSKDEKAADIWNVTYTFLMNDREYKVHYQYDFWLDSVDSQKFHIEGIK